MTLLGDPKQEGTMIVTVDINDLDTVISDGSVVRITGTSQEDPTQRIAFAGDHRSMEGLLAIVQEAGEVSAVIEDWQVLSTRTVEPA